MEQIISFENKVFYTKPVNIEAHKYGHPKHWHEEQASYQLKHWLTR